MALVYDLPLKFDGVAAFCGFDISDVIIGALLYSDTRNAQSQREAVSRLKAGQLPLAGEDARRLTAYFNQQIAKVARGDGVQDESGPLRPEDWERPMNEFFAEIAERHPHLNEALDRAHAAIIERLTVFDEYRSRAIPLGMQRHVGQSYDRPRFPQAAVPVDTLTLPTLRFKAGRDRPDQMVIEITQPVARPSRGWMFFVRNPDVRANGAKPNRAWDQAPGDLIRWQPSPFTLEEGFFGALPGYPCEVGELEGEYSAYLLVEDMKAKGVQRSLEVSGAEWNPALPTYEQTVHMMARARTLFQRGNVGEVGYDPPTLLMRRYRVLPSS